MEDKLKRTLQELKPFQELCEQLLKEEADCEVEMGKNIKKDSDLKSDLHNTYLEVELQRDQLY